MKTCNNCRALSIEAKKIKCKLGYNNFSELHRGAYQAVTRDDCPKPMTHKAWVTEALKKNREK